MRKFLLLSLIPLISLPAFSQGIRTTADTSALLRSRLLTGEYGLAIRPDNSLYILRKNQTPFRYTLNYAEILGKPTAYPTTIAGVLHLADSLAAKPSLTAFNFHTTVLGQKANLSDVVTLDAKVNTRTAYRTLSEVRSSGESALLAPGVINLTDAGRAGLFVLAPSDTASDNGGTVIRTSANLCYKRPYTGAINVRWFGAKGDGVTDDADAFKNALRVVQYMLSTIPGQNGLYVPAGKYLLGETLGLTNTRTPGPAQRDGIKVYGDGMNYTTLIGKTGAGHAILDISGSQWLTLENLTLTTDGSTGSSTIGIYSGCFAVLPQTQNQLISRVSIFMHHDPSANSGNGTMAYLNFGSEENTHNAIYYVANRPVYLTAYSNSPTYAYPRSPLLASHSLGVTTFSGECFLQAIGSLFPALETIDVNSVQADNLYIHGSVIAGLTPTQGQAIRVRGVSVNAHLRGTIEGFGGMLQVYGHVLNSEFKFTLGNTNTFSDPIVKLERGGEGQIENSSVWAFATVDTDRPFWGLAPAAANEAVSCFIKDSDFRSNQTLSGMTPPEKLIWNPSTGGVSLSSRDAPTYKLDAGFQQLAMPAKLIRGVAASPASAIVATLQLPTPVATTSAGSIVVKISGIAGHAAPQNGGSQTAARWEGSLPITVNYNGTATVGTATTTLSTVGANGSDNAITSIALTGVMAGTTVQVVLTPTTSGAGNERLYFSGKIELTYLGHTCNAPSLKLN